MASKLKLYLIIIISFSFVIAVVETIVNSVIYNIYTIFYVDLKGCCLFPCAWMCLFIFFYNLFAFFRNIFWCLFFLLPKKKKIRWRFEWHVSISPWIGGRKRLQIYVFWLGFMRRLENSHFIYFFFFDYKFSLS